MEYIGTLNLPDMSRLGQFHHLGIAVDSLGVEIRRYKGMGYLLEGPTFIDVVQGVRGVFLQGIGPRLELLENAKESNTLSPWRNRGYGPYHTGILSPNLEASRRLLLSWGWKTISQPTPAVAFSGSEIQFFMDRNLGIIELIQDQITN